MQENAVAGSPVWRRVKSVLTHVLLMFGAIIMILPLYWMVATSLKSYPETLAYPPKFIPSIPQWINYVDAWHSQTYFARYFYNSFYVTIVTMVTEVIMTIFASYAFARMKFLGKNILFALFLSTMMIPGEVLLVPNFITITKLNWYDTYAAMIIPFTVSVFAIFLLRQHFLQIPFELQEAAYLDGAGHTRFLFQIMLPLSRPPIATIALLKFIGSWNAFLWPLLVTQSAELRTVPIGLMSLMQDEGLKYHIWMASATLAMIPVLAVFLAAQKQFLESVAKSGLKG
ncbi:MAG TPA: carbohydrate ABC transporter permease [Symbiobacteriaceae bacterium]|jgi:multiple sugar transport system permease protein|nr:carbohydrate ABC transporter permease [Symbiobacteriaceae bacterium]